MITSENHKKMFVTQQEHVNYHSFCTTYSPELEKHSSQRLLHKTSIFFCNKFRLTLLKMYQCRQWLAFQLVYSSFNFCCSAPCYTLKNRHILHENMTFHETIPRKLAHHKEPPVVSQDSVLTGIWLHGFEPISRTSAQVNSVGENP